MSNLIPCPFCASEAKYFAHNDGGYGCSNMMCEPLYQKQLTKLQWNTRPIEEKQAAEIERLKTETAELKTYVEWQESEETNELD